MRRTIRRQSQATPIIVRCGDTDLGFVTGLQGAEGGLATMTGRFTHAPAYAEHADTMLALADALHTGDAARAGELRSQIEARGVHVHHVQHDMRIDKPGTITVDRGEVSFSPSDAYQIMRSGGL